MDDAAVKLDVGEYDGGFLKEARGQDHGFVDDGGLDALTACDVGECWRSEEGG